MLSPMADRSPAQHVRDYYASLQISVRRRLRELRGIILSVAPDAEETISYRIPAFKQGGRILVYCAGWQEHTSLYPLTAGMRQACATDLARFETSKGTIRFPNERPLPVAVIRRLVKARLRELDAATKRARPARA
jgi:uncharacterized protein YdhG (YjbR/CyaY superfamily)